jgi:hypothetical protein
VAEVQGPSIWEGPVIAEIGDGDVFEGLADGGHLFMGLGIIW